MIFCFNNFALIKLGITKNSLVFQAELEINAIFLFTFLSRHVASHKKLYSETRESHF